jgi:hypothetical protein
VLTFSQNLVLSNPAHDCGKGTYESPNSSAGLVTLFLPAWAFSFPNFRFYSKILKTIPFHIWSNITCLLFLGVSTPHCWQTRSRQTLLWCMVIIILCESVSDVPAHTYLMIINVWISPITFLIKNKYYETNCK